VQVASRDRPATISLRDAGHASRLFIVTRARRGEADGELGETAYSKFMNLAARFHPKRMKERMLSFYATANLRGASVRVTRTSFICIPFSPIWFHHPMPNVRTSSLVIFV